MIASAFKKKLILDELFDLTLYKELRNISRGETKAVFAELIPIEERHLAFWQDFFQIKVTSLDPMRRIKLRVLVIVSWLFGENAMHLVLEAIEVYGIRKYLALWQAYRGEALGEAVRGILTDEFKHEDVVVSRMLVRKINPERIRNIFLGLNDGLVEIVGAVSGFFAAFGNPAAVLVAAFTTAVAGSISMAASGYAGASSQTEIEKMESTRKEFLGEEKMQMSTESALFSGLSVGASYFIGAMVPVIPVIFGSKNLLLSLIAAAVAMTVTSLILAFLSGMMVRKRIILNLSMFGIAVAVTYAIGIAAKAFFGIVL